MTKMNSFSEDSKRSALGDITNNHTLNDEDSDSSDRKSWERFDEQHWFPKQRNARNEPASIVPEQSETQNVHRISLAITTI